MQLIMDANYYNKKLKSFGTLLSRWQGCQVKLWEFQHSHTSLTLRLERDSVTGNLHIICIEPISFCGSIKLPDSNICIDHDGNYFIVRDNSGFLEIKSMDMEIKENCKPFS